MLCDRHKASAVLSSAAITAYKQCFKDPDDNAWRSRLISRPQQEVHLLWSAFARSAAICKGWPTPNPQSGSSTCRGRGPYPARPVPYGPAQVG